jgi:hypothetical protein
VTNDEERARSIPKQVTDHARGLIDHALARVFDEPYDIRTPDDFERVMVEGAGTASLVSTGAIAAMVARATPWVERALPIASKSAKAGKAVPAVRYVVMALPIAMQVSTAIRHGLRELQVLASYLIRRFRDEGIEPSRDLVTAIALSLALDPDRRPDVRLTPGRAGPGLVRRWLLRSLGQDTHGAVRRRARTDLAAIERIDLRALAEEWGQEPPRALPPGRPDELPGEGK